MKNYEDIPGWFSPQDCNEYLFLIENISETGVIVEVGSWLGKSTSFLFDHKKPGQTVVAVDTWKGSKNELQTTHKIATQTDIFELFKQNMGDRDIKIIRKESVVAATMFEDYSLDAVFIDAEHTYDACTADIKAWYTKIKPGGFLAGHDYSWPGVKKAVDEIFGSNAVTGINGSCWRVQKPSIPK